MITPRMYISREGVATGAVWQGFIQCKGDKASRRGASGSAGRFARE